MHGIGDRQHPEAAEGLVGDVDGAIDERDGNPEIGSDRIPESCHQVRRDRVLAPADDEDPAVDTPPGVDGLDDGLNLRKLRAAREVHVAVDAHDQDRAARRGEWQRQQRHDETRE